MKNVTDSFISLDYWPSAGSFGFNTDILATNPINLSVVLGGLIFLERECNKNFIFEDFSFYDFGTIRKNKNETIHFEQERAINQIRQRVFQQALQGALETLNSCLNTELHLRIISANIDMFGAMKEITD
uniref:CF0 subunit I n=1 Tax=Vaccinium floribundum TaxID=180757 RepID=UPI0024354B40|nr:CF0 subunit I [Vaccinium floribundum]WEY34981.1 CF0 subunit I [Vaccinium floribundum]